MADFMSESGSKPEPKPHELGPSQSDFDTSQESARNLVRNPSDPPEINTDEDDHADEDIAISLDAKNPWPYVCEFFQFLKTTTAGNSSNKKGYVTAHYQCVLCKPKTWILKVNTSSRGNLTRHVESHHKASLHTFRRILDENKKRRQLKITSLSSQGQASGVQQSVADMLSSSKAANWVTQSEVDKAVLRFVMETGQAFHVVEDTAFINLIKTLQPSKEVMSRDVLMTRMKSKMKEMTCRIKNHLQRSEYVSLTCDIWSGGHRSFLGVTVHTLDPDTLERTNYAIACRRMEGRHTFDKITSALKEILEEWSISWKTSGIVTDNATNFIKAFKIHGAKSRQLGHSIEEPTSSPGERDEQDSADMPLTDEDELPPDLLGEILDKADSETELPLHFRCAAHTLNLVATTDCQAALKPRNSDYAKLYYSTFAKLNKIWNSYNQSPLFSDKVKELFPSKTLVTPTATRWNSLFDAVQRVRELRDVDSNAFSDLLVAGKAGGPLKAAESAFLDEWAEVMQHLANALDLLQGDAAMYLGYLLPTVSYLKDYLKDARDKVNTSKPLIEAALSGIDKRFGPFFERREMLVSAAYLPEFKVEYLDENYKQLARKFLQEEASLEKTEGATALQGSIQSTSSFFAKRPRKTDTAEMEVNRYLADDSPDLHSVLAYKRIRKVFLKHNVILPSSASSERLFSKAKLLLRGNRQRMGDKAFEDQLLLCANKAV